MTLLLVFSVSHYFLYQMFGIYSEKMLLHYLCLKEFKESPTSKRLIKNLPPMDIIKEYEEDEVETVHGSTPPHVRKLRQFSEQLQ